MTTILKKQNTVKIFISYAHKDEFYKDELLKQLKHLERNGIINGWHDRLIQPGEEWDDIIKKELYECELILFLISADFLSSDYIYDTEIRIAFERYERKEVKIVPVILRPCLWQDTEFSKFQELPKNGKFLSTWGNLDEGLLNVAKAISKIIKGETPIEPNKKQAIQLPVELAEDLITNNTNWVKSLKQAFLKYGISVSNKPAAIFQNYGWLIEIYLQKMFTNVGKERSLRRLSFMAEAFQSSLRYLCYIQIAQVLMSDKQAEMSASITNFFRLTKPELFTFNWFNFLIADDIIKNNENFVSEIPELINKLKKTGSNLNGAVLFLTKIRNQLLNQEILEDENLDQLLNEYLTALVFWLRNIAFLAKYRLASIKDINLNYRLGSAKNFVHLYGELHGMYSELYGEEGDFMTHSIQDFFTYNKSVLLFKGSDIANCLNQIRGIENYLSLSPLIIDQSVFAEKETQTPEIYYYTGNNDNRYYFNQYKNELEYVNDKEFNSNKSMEVKMQNNNQPKLNDLYLQLEEVLQNAKTPEL